MWVTCRWWYFFVIVDYVTWKKTFPFLLFHYLDFIMHNICMTLNFFLKLFQISRTQRILLWCRARARNMQLNLFIVRKEIATELDGMWSDSGRIWLKKLVCSIYLSENILLEPDLALVSNNHQVFWPFSLPDYDSGLISIQWTVLVIDF